MMTLQNVEAPSAQRFDGSREHRLKPLTSRTILPDSVVIVAEPDDSGIFNPLTKAPRAPSAGGAFCLSVMTDLYLRTPKTQEHL